MENKTKQTQENIVLNHLQEKGYITKLEAMDKYNITNLGEKIRVLREKGYKIYTIMIPTKNKDNVYARYTLAKNNKLLV